MYLNIHYPNEVFLKEWLARPVGVIFDYGQDRDLIYLLPMRGRHPEAVCRFYKRCDLIDALKIKSELFMQSAAQMVSSYRQQEQLKREAEIEARHKEEQKAKLELQRKINEAICRAQKIQQVELRKVVYFPVEGTPIYVDARGGIYELVNGQLIPKVANGLAGMPRYTMRHHQRL